MLEHMTRRLEKNFPVDLEYIMRDPLLFGDYRNALNENEPRFYEDLLDYDAIYYLFQEVCLLCEIFFACLQLVCVCCTNCIKLKRKSYIVSVHPQSTQQVSMK